MALTEDQLTDLRNDLGDTKNPPAFPDEELERLFARTSEDYSKTMVLALDQLIMSAVKFSDYTQNESQEKKSQIFDHLLKVRAIWQQRVADEAEAAVVLPTRTSAIVPIRPTWRRKSRPDACH